MTSPIDITFLRDTRHGGAQAQPTEIASRLADFVEAATHSIDIAIYDFRLTDSLAGPVVSALIAAADRGVVVRIGYDEGKPAAGTATDFAALGADPAPIGTAQWVAEHFAGTAVQIRGIAAGRQLMHSKYVIRDAAAGSAAVWTGSMNFTDDAWTLQENNILTIESRKLARAFRTDFGQMWTTGKISGTGARDSGTTAVGDVEVSWDFSPGDGKAIDAALVSLVQAATTRIVIATMVLTSRTVLTALAAAVTGGLPVTGIYDSGQMDPIVEQWKTIPADASVVADWQVVSAVLAAKQSAPYTPTSTHDFMHDKILVCDDTVATGSYNFSANAQKNAENQLHVTDPAFAGRYVDYIDAISATYRHSATG